MRRLSVVFLFLVLCVAMPAATLQYLSVDQMTSEATSIVRGVVVGSHTTVRGPVVYTLYTLRIAERLKGRSANTIDIAVPGGVADGARQTFAGAPQLQPGVEYLIFAWRTKSGLNVILGLSQGLFVITPGASGSDPIATQTATSELMLNNRLQEITTSPARISLSQLRVAAQRSAEGQ